MMQSDPMSGPNTASVPAQSCLSPLSPGEAPAGKRYAGAFLIFALLVLAGAAAYLLGIRILGLAPLAVSDEAERVKNWTRLIGCLAMAVSGLLMLPAAFLARRKAGAVLLGIALLLPAAAFLCQCLGSRIGYRRELADYTRRWFYSDSYSYEVLPPDAGQYRVVRILPGLTGFLAALLAGIGCFTGAKRLRTAAAAVLISWSAASVAAAVFTLFYSASDGELFSAAGKREWFTDGHLSLLVLLAGLAVLCFPTGEDRPGQERLSPPAPRKRTSVMTPIFAIPLLGLAVVYLLWYVFRQADDVYLDSGSLRMIGYLWVFSAEALAFSGALLLIASFLGRRGASLCGFAALLLILPQAYPAVRDLRFRTVFTGSFKYALVYFQSGLYWLRLVGIVAALLSAIACFTRRRGLLAAGAAMLISKAVFDLGRVLLDYPDSLDLYETGGYDAAYLENNEFLLTGALLLPGLLALLAALALLVFPLGKRREKAQ